MHGNPIPGRAAEALDLAGATLAPRCETYEVAIEALVADGLLRREGDSIHPTRAALRAEKG